MINENKIKMVNIQQIAEKGAEIYSKIKGQYEPKENGKFLAIEIDSKKEKDELIFRTVHEKVASKR